MGTTGTDEVETSMAVRIVRLVTGDGTEVGMTRLMAEDPLQGVEEIIETLTVDLIEGISQCDLCCSNFDLSLFVADMVVVVIMVVVGIMAIVVVGTETTERVVTEEETVALEVDAGTMVVMTTEEVEVTTEEGAATIEEAPQDQGNTVEVIGKRFLVHLRYTSGYFPEVCKVCACAYSYGHVFS